MEKIDRDYHLVERKSNQGRWPVNYTYLYHPPYLKSLDRTYLSMAPSYQVANPDKIILER